jgi:hypothetical protein
MLCLRRAQSDGLQNRSHWPHQWGHSRTHLVVPRRLDWLSGSKHIYGRNGFDVRQLNTPAISVLTDVGLRQVVVNITGSANSRHGNFRSHLVS